MLGCKDKKEITSRTDTPQETPRPTILSHLPLLTPEAHPPSLWTPNPHKPS